jgi:hypothetical protein
LYLPNIINHIIIYKGNHKGYPYVKLRSLLDINVGAPLVGGLYDSFIIMRGFMSTIDELSVEFFEEGVQTVKQLDKVILSKGAWTTIIFRYQDFDAKKNEFGPDKYSIRRYQKKDDAYKMRSKFNISSKDQAEKIIQALQTWIA